MTEQYAGISRREFLRRLTQLGSLAACYPAATLASARTNAQTPSTSDWLNKDPWKTLAAVQQHMLPAAEDTPGASDIQATAYLRNAIENPAADGADQTFVFNGVGWLNDLTQDQYQQSFTVLNEQQRENVLRKIEQSTAGRNWLSLLLTYLLEALLADPVYGGNPGGIGWQWLAHQPGFPRPPADKTWYRLAAPVHYQRKA